MFYCLRILQPYFNAYYFKLTREGFMQLTPVEKKKKKNEKVTFIKIPDNIDKDSELEDKNWRDMINLSTLKKFPKRKFIIGLFKKLTSYTILNFDNFIFKKV